MDTNIQNQLRYLNEKISKQDDVIQTLQRQHSEQEEVNVALQKHNLMQEESIIELKQNLAVINERLPIKSATPDVRGIVFKCY